MSRRPPWRSDTRCLQYSARKCDGRFSKNKINRIRTEYLGILPGHEDGDNTYSEVVRSPVKIREESLMTSKRSESGPQGTQER